MLTRRSLGAVAGSALLTPLFRGKAGADTSARTHPVEIRKFLFEPAVLRIRPGDSIEWTNRDVVPHTATGRDHAWDTGALQKGESVVVTFTDPGQVDYFCAFHPHMAAKIITTET